VRELVSDENRKGRVRRRTGAKKSSNGDNFCWHIDSNKYNQKKMNNCLRTVNFFHKLNRVSSTIWDRPTIPSIQL
jgi:hypothetical protein